MDWKNTVDVSVCRYEHLFYKFITWVDKSWILSTAVSVHWACHTWVTSGLSVTCDLGQNGILKYWTHQIWQPSSYLLVCFIWFLSFMNPEIKPVFIFKKSNFLHTHSLTVTVHFLQNLLQCFMFSQYICVFLHCYICWLNSLIAINTWATFTRENKWMSLNIRFYVQNLLWRQG